jgi:hypothetical protein
MPREYQEWPYARRLAYFDLGSFFLDACAVGGWRYSYPNFYRRAA